jgi:hypothetical protein
MFRTNPSKDFQHETVNIEDLVPQDYLLIPYLERLDRQISRFVFQVEEVALDAGYLTMPICQGLNERKILAVIAHRSFSTKEGFVL